MIQGQNNSRSSCCTHILYAKFILSCIQLCFTHWHLHLSNFEHHMDEHYDVNNAGEWINILKDCLKLTQNGTGAQLEE